MQRHSRGYHIPTHLMVYSDLVIVSCCRVSRPMGSLRLTWVIELPVMMSHMHALPQLGRLGHVADLYSSSRRWSMAKEMILLGMDKRLDLLLILISIINHYIFILVNVHPKSLLDFPETKKFASQSSQSTTLFGELWLWMIQACQS